MAETRAKAIIAVFGSNDSAAVKAAKKLGNEIAQRDQILLTGGSRPGAESVKNSAIDGAGGSPWVGVERKPRQVVASRVGSGLVTYTDLNHKRNYLEACLCDAAIGFKGGEGTSSEVTFALALQRPVVLVGDEWKAEGSLDESSVLDSMVDRAFNLVGREPTGRGDFDALLNESTIRRSLDQLPPYKYVPVSITPEDIIGWILGVLGSYGKRGDFPFLVGYERVSEQYEKWLASNAV